MLDNEDCLGNMWLEIYLVVSNNSNSFLTNVADKFLLERMMLDHTFTTEAFTTNKNFDKEIRTRILCNPRCETLIVFSRNICNFKNDQHDYQNRKPSNLSHYLLNPYFHIKKHQRNFI